MTSFIKYRVFSWSLKHESEGKDLHREVVKRLMIQAQTDLKITYWKRSWHKSFGEWTQWKAIHGLMTVSARCNAQ